MLIATAFLLPLILYVIARRFIGQNPLLTITAALAVALTSTLCGLAALFYAEAWTPQAQIAWTGVRSHNNLLTIGGARETATIGWSNNAFSPQLTVAAEGDNASLEISGGDAFVQRESDGTKEYLNGSSIGSDFVPARGNYKLRVQSDWLYFGRYLEVSDNSQIIASIRLPSVSGDKVFALDNLLEARTKEITSENPHFQALENFKREAQDFRLLIRHNGDIRILDLDDRARANCVLPCRITILWAGSKIRAELYKSPDSDLLALNYLPPRRNLSPLPPTEAQMRLVVAEQAQPGDFAFTLPLGKAESDLRGTLNFKNNQDAETVLVDSQSPPNNDAARPPWLLSPCQTATGLEGNTSCAAVRGKTADFVFFTVRDLPDSWSVLWLVAFAFVLFGLGLLLVWAEMPATNRWVVCGVASALWNLLMIRLLLAFDYALDPAYLDGLAVSGVTLSLVGLAIFPGFLLLLARLRSDKYAPSKQLPARHRKLALGYLGLLLVGFFVEFYLAPDLWSNLPPEFRPSLDIWTRKGILMWAGLILFFGFLALHINFFYQNKIAGIRVWQRVFVEPFEFLARFFEWAKERYLPKRLERPLGGRDWGLLFFGNFLWLILLPGALLIVGAILSGDDHRLITQIAVPVLCFWLLVLFWLAARSLCRASMRLPKHFRVFAVIQIVAMTILICVMVGVVMRDSGGLLAFFAALIPLAAVLIAGSTKTRFFGYVFGGFLILALVGSVVVYRNVNTLFPWLPGEIGVRFLAYKEGRDLEKYLLVADVAETRIYNQLTVSDVQNAMLHGWENQAIAHESGMFGFGLGNAPVRRSSVRQDTVQYDSVFSFYIIGEWGIIGGLSLLLIYAVPMVLILIGAQKRFDAGYAFAFVIASAFLIEALLHAAMNLNALPFTGRDLPLLAVNSFKGDLLRWLIMFGLATITLFWRYKSGEDFNAKAEAIIGETGSSTASDDQSPQPGFVAELRQNPRQFLRARFASTIEPILWLTAVPVLLFLVVLAQSWLIWTSRELENPFDWETVATQIRWLVDNRVVSLKGDTDCPEIELRVNLINKNQVGEKLDAKFLQAQIDRFNAQPCEDRIGRGAFAGSIDSLGNVSDVDGYKRLLEQFRQNDLPARRRRQTNLFRLEKLVKQSEEGTPQAFEQNEQHYRIIPNPDLNGSLTFKVEREKTDIPALALASGEKLVAPAWVKGRWTVALDNNPSLLSWTEFLARGLFLERMRLGGDGAAQFYQALTLEGDLHQAAVRFVDRKGSELHADLLKKNNFKNNPASRGKEWEQNLPPRVGLTVMRLTSGAHNGAIVALGSYPRAVSGNQWRQNAKGDWLPPLSLVQTRFPAPLQPLYLFEHNFDAGVVMGSTTKPIWAAAALAVNPSLKSKLQTSGAGGGENSVFGINIPGKGWSVRGSRAPWVNFDRFLTESNNRYAVRLGFLGLAEKSGDGEVSIEKDKDSPSVLESMNGAAPRIWRKFPKFSEKLGFSANDSSKFENLQTTELARKLRSLFGVGIERGRLLDRADADYRTYLYSFWTKNEANDAASQFDKAPSASQIYSFIPAITPVRAQFAFDYLTNPRDYVSALFGGGANRWSNVQLAAGFGSCVTGKPVLPHIVHNNTPPVFYGREADFTTLAKEIRPGLEGVVFAANGTMAGKFEADAQEILQSLRNSGYGIYAKTGTLQNDSDVEATSRIVLAIVKFEDADKTRVKNGLVFSLFGERASIFTSTVWLGKFLSENKAAVHRLLETDAK